MNFQPHEKHKYSTFLQPKRLGLFGLTILIVFITSISFSGTVHAGLVSFFETLVGKQEVAAKMNQYEKLSSSQTSTSIVLQPTGGSNPSSSLIDIPPIEGNSTLSADIARMNSTSSEPLNTQISIYVVRPGDTISGVAKMYNVSINTVLWANDLSGRSVLQPGQTLIILPVTGVTHTIKAGDTIKSIAKKYGADVDDILHYNDLTINARLTVGEEILIPNAEITSQRLSTSGSTGLSLDYSSNWPVYSGYFSCPVPGARVSQKIHGHNGIDLAAPKGTPIRAAAGGTVIINRANGAWNGGYGNFVVILHSNGSQTLYSHLLKSTVYAGENVSAHEVIGYIGMTGLTTGPHLHFEVRGAQNLFSNQSYCR